MFQTTTLLSEACLACSAGCVDVVWQWQKGLSPGGTICQSPRGSLCDIASLWWVFLFSYLLERQGCVQTWCHTHVHWHLCWENVHPCLSASVSATCPLPPPPHGSPCSRLAPAFLSPHGDSASCPRLKNNFFHLVGLFLRPAVCLLLSCSCLLSESASLEQGADQGKKLNARARRSENVFLAAVTPVMLAEEQAWQKPTALSGNWDR